LISLTDAAMQNRILAALAPEPVVSLRPVSLGERFIPVNVTAERVRIAKRFL
jgi:hypothetical protein